MSPSTARLRSPQSRGEKAAPSRLPRLHSRAEQARRMPSLAAGQTARARAVPCHAGRPVAAAPLDSEARALDIAALAPESVGVARGAPGARAPERSTADPRAPVAERRGPAAPAGALATASTLAAATSWRAVRGKERTAAAGAGGGPASVRFLSVEGTRAPPGAWASGTRRLARRR